MLLFPPKQFDENEWFILMTIAAGYVLMAFLPKRYPIFMSVLLVLFCVSAAYIFDHSIASPPLNLYHINDYPQYEFMDLFTYVMYSPYALLCVYLYQKVHPKRLWFTGYVIAWALFCTFFEWLSVLCHVFTFHGWSIVYSFAVYLFMTTIYLWFFEYLLRTFREQGIKKGNP